MGAAEDGRAPTEERTSVKGWSFRSMGAAGDGRAPTEERMSVQGWGFCSTGAAVSPPTAPAPFLASL